MNNETFWKNHAKVGWELAQWRLFCLQELGVDPLEVGHPATLPHNLNQEIMDTLDALVAESSVNNKGNSLKPL